MELSVLLGLFALASAKPLTWEAHTVRDAAAKDYIVTAAKLKAASGHNLQVVRYQRGHPTAHIVLLPPAPGQGAKYWEGELTALGTMYERDYVLYAVDLRGTGEFPYLENDDTSWTRNPLKDNLRSKARDLILTDMTMGGLAYDVSTIVERVKEDPAFQGRLILHARGFGALIAMETLRREGDRYESAVLESHIPVDAWTNVQNDTAFLNQCANDDFCRRQFGGLDPRQLRTAVVSIGSPGYNECSSVMLEEIGKLGGEFSRLPSDASDALRLQEFLTPFLYGRVKLSGGHHSATLVVPFLSNAYMCPDVKEFKTAVLPAMIKLAKGAGVAKVEHFGRGVDVTNFVNAWFMMQDIFNMASEKQHICQSPNPLGLASPCVIYQYYHRYVKWMRKQLHKRTATYAEVKAPKTNLYFVGGGLDLLTPLETTERLHGKAEGKSKRLIKFQLQGHNPLSEGVCARELGAEILGTGDKSKTDACLDAANAQKIDWLFPNLKEAAASAWWAAPGGDSTRKPTSQAPPGAAGQHSTLQIAAIVIGCLAVVAVVAHVIWILTRRKQGAHDFE